MSEKKGEFDALAEALFKGSIALQSTQVLTRPRTAANLIQTTSGLVGISVAAPFASKAFELVNPSGFTKKKKRR